MEIIIFWGHEGKERMIMEPEGVKSTVTRKGKGQQKGFHMISGVQNPKIKRYRNFYLTCFSGGVVKRAEKKELKEGD